MDENTKSYTSSPDCSQEVKVNPKNDIPNAKTHEFIRRQIEEQIAYHTNRASELAKVLPLLTEGSMANMELFKLLKNLQIYF